ncbi:amidase family protein [Frigidibacter mobilis]|uniref:Amidase n=1 Tax=Frigidibacter mobilis TaxID=1335048 RepID=A0A159Z5F0_9RHOB|nr:amidase [Frigidibacter mobilis]AMY70466.1 amidase [Frigidibacter mobilis]
MTPFDPKTATARGIAAAVRSGTLAPEAVAEAYLDRIAAVEPSLNAFVWLDPAHVRAEAATRHGGFLAGVPVGIKDVIDTGDMPTEYGSRAYPGVRPPRDAGVVHIVRQAGAFAIGKTVTTEFATAAPGATVNPFDSARTPGGSSSGSAAGLGAALFPLAFGTQTSGSTVRPASFCGVVGYKASPHLIDRTGVKPLSETLDVVGLMARDTRDCALLAAAAMRRPELVPTEEAIDLPRIGLFAPMRLTRPLPSPLPCWSAWVALSRGRGRGPSLRGGTGLAPRKAMCSPGKPRPALARNGICTGTFCTQPPMPSLAGTTGSPATTGWPESPPATRPCAISMRCLAIVTCSSLSPRPARRRWGSARRGRRPTISAGPCLAHPRCPSLPAWPNGLPIGIQLVARPGEDARLLAAAAAVEDALRAAGLVARPE